MRDFITWSKPSKTGDGRKWVTLQHYYSITLISQYSFGTWHIKSNLCFVYWVLLCFVFIFFLKICIIMQWYIRSVFWKKWRSVLFITCRSAVRNYMHILTNSSTVFISEKHILWIHLGENFIDIWDGADFGPYSWQSFQKYSYLINHVSAETLPTGRVITPETNSQPVDVSTQW